MKTFLNCDCFQPLSHNYNFDYESLRMEVELTKRTLSGKYMETISDVFLGFPPFREAYAT